MLFVYACVVLYVDYSSLVAYVCGFFLLNFSTANGCIHVGVLVCAEVCGLGYCAMFSLLTPLCFVLPRLLSPLLPSLCLPSLPLKSYLDHLSALCVSKGTAVQSVQMLVCNTVLEEQNKDILMQIR